MSMRSIAAGALALALGANNVLAGDGVVSGIDHSMIFADWGQCTSSGNCLSDITGDGTVDGADLGYVIGFRSR